MLCQKSNSYLEFVILIDTDISKELNWTLQSNIQFRLLAPVALEHIYTKPNKILNTFSVQSLKDQLLVKQALVLNSL